MASQGFGRPARAPRRIVNDTGFPYTGRYQEMRHMNDAIAEQFVRARLDATALPDFPGSIPATLNTAYAYQDRAIALWPDFVAGWKVGRVGEPWLERLSEARLRGPIVPRAVPPHPP